jgi:phage terminase large subunit-like protein
VTTKSTSNHTAIVVGGQLPDPRRVLVEHAEQGRINGLQLRERVWDYCEIYPDTLDTLLIEINQGGDRNLEVLEPLPSQLTQVVPYRNSTGKRPRIEGEARRYHRGAILHHPALKGGELEDQQCLWVPGAEEDDLLDAVAGLERWFLDGWPGDPSAADRRLRAVE